MGLKKDTISNVIGNGISIVLGIVTVPLYLKNISVETYGELLVIWTIISYVTLLDLGFGRSILRKIASNTIEEEEINKILWTGVISTLVFGVIASVTLKLCSNVLVFKLFKTNLTDDNIIMNSINLVLITIPIIIPSVVLQSALLAKLKFVNFNIIQAISSITSQTTPLLCAYIGYKSLDILVASALIAKWITLIIFYFQCKKYVYLSSKPTYKLSYAKDLVKDGGWFTGVSIIGPILSSIDKIIILKLMGVKHVPYYSIPYDLTSKTMIITSSFSSALYPRFANKVKNKNLVKDAKSLLRVIMGMIVIVGIFILKPFLYFWLNEKLAYECSGIGEIILVGVYINSIIIADYTKLIATEGPKKILLLYLIELPIYLVILFYFINKFGIKGAALAWTFRVIIDTVGISIINKSLRESVILSIVPLIAISIALIFESQLDYQSIIRYFLSIIICGFFFLFEIKKDKFHITQ